MTMPRRARTSIAAEAEYDGKCTLRVLGVEFGEVNSIQAPRLFEGGTNSFYQEDWPDFVSRIFSLLPAYEGESEFDRATEVMMRTLCWNYFGDPTQALQSDEHSLTQVKETLLRWREYLAKERRYHGVCEPPPISRGDLCFKAEVEEGLARYSRFRTTEGHLGLGPRLAAQGDKVCVVLGCDSPLLLRLVSDDQWSIVGGCYVHDVAGDSALLSSLPDDFQLIERVNSRTGGQSMAFRNMQTNEIQIQDPRITEPLPAGWEVVKHVDESYYQLFRNKEQNLYTWHDPRLTPDALRARGVKLKTFNLV